MDGLRKGLAESIQTHKAASSRVVSAAQTVEKATAYIKQLEAEIASFESAEAAIATERAAAIKATMATGGAPSFALSPELQSTVAQRTETETTLAAARQAAAALAGEHSSAIAAEREAKDHVEAAARGVIAAELSNLADNIRELEAKSTMLRAKLHGAAMIFDSGMVARPSRFRLPAGALEVMSQRSPTEQVTSLNSPAQKRSIEQSARWQAYLRELMSDADAVFD